MKTQRAGEMKTVRWLSAILLFSVALTMSTPTAVLAAGTAAGTHVDNRATISYDVGGSSLSIESSPTGNSTVGAGNGADTGFNVDRMVDLTVARGADSYKSATAGFTSVLTFTVTNTGNDTFDFNLSASDLSGVNDPYGGTDNLDGITVSGIYVESDGPGDSAGYVSGDHSYDAATDTVESINNLPQDYTVNVYVVCNIPAAAANGNIAVMLMQAAALASDGSALTQTTGADTSGIDTVFADDAASAAGATDTARNARDQETDAFQVQAPSLTVSKTSAVTWDPVNLYSNPKAVPGAYIEYTITVSNATGAAEAANVMVVDDLTTLIATDNYLAFRSNAYSDANEITVQSPGVNGGTLTELTEETGDDQGEFSSNTLTVNCGNLVAGQQAVVKFQVVVQ